MATIRAFAPIARQTASRGRVAGAMTARRFLNTETAPSLYAARAQVIGARTGAAKGENLDVGLTMAKALGGEGDKGKTNPEELFAAGYGACFQSAMNAVAPSVGVKMPSNVDDSVVDTTVHLVGSMKQLDMGIRVDMKVKVKGVSQADLEKVINKAKEVCPYSRATQGNVHTTITSEAS